MKNSPIMQSIKANHAKNMGFVFSLSKPEEQRQDDAQVYKFFKPKAATARALFKSMSGQVQDIVLLRSLKWSFRAEKAVVDTTHHERRSRSIDAVVEDLHGELEDSLADNTHILTRNGSQSLGLGMTEAAPAALFNSLVVGERFPRLLYRNIVSAGRFSGLPESLRPRPIQPRRNLIILRRIAQ